MLTRILPVVFAAGSLTIVGALCLVAGDGADHGSAGRARLLVRACGTPDLTDRELDAVDRLTDRMLKRRGLTLDSIPSGAANLGTINVAVHVIYYTSGQQEIGNLPTSVIEDQIDVLNAAYDNVTFNLASIDRTNNQAWFNMTPGSSAEYQAKSTLCRPTLTSF